MKKEKIAIYFVPGLAASPNIFEFIELNKERFEIVFLEWLIPTSKKEPLSNYVKRMCKNIRHTKFILVGVSFGGIMVQEMSTHCKPIKTIIISSVKHEDEFPKRLITIRKTKAYKLTPISVLSNIELFAKFAFGTTIKKRVDLYQKYLAMRDKTYLPWAIYNVLHWKQTNKNKDLIHIHGNNDNIFPIKNIKDCHIIEGGTHIMILNKAKKISEIIENLC